ncbi:MAG: nucleoside phosphorylase, partial [Clostridiales Family XIII bacterium]|nr:nucleoside phosphorylase [Clostridiales Family XIII bacterium]
MDDRGTGTRAQEGGNRASAPQSAAGGVLHLDLKPGDVPAYAILPGDPARTLKIAEGWADVTEVAYNREFKTVTGTYEGQRIAAVSTGIGAASSEICIHELHLLGVHTCVRVGTTGSLSGRIGLGDLIIPTACVRKDGTSGLYIEPEYPAAADTYVVMALMQACETLGYRYGLGIGYTAGSFYVGQGRPLAGDGSGYAPSAMEHLLPDLISAGVTNIEMEAAGQFVVGRLHGMRMGAVLAVVANRVTDEWGDAGGEEKACRAAAEAVRILAEWDRSGEISVRLGMRATGGGQSFGTQGEHSVSTKPGDVPAYAI